MDASQDATLIAFTVDQITAESTATFSRPLITGDVDDDDALDVPLYLQYAYGNITNASLNQIGDPGDNRWISRHRLSFDCSGVLQFCFLWLLCDGGLVIECSVDHLYACNSAATCVDMNVMATDLCTLQWNFSCEV